jgi:5'(3')-deoxyribonucleotidase
MANPIFAIDLDGVIVDLLGTAVRRAGVTSPFTGYESAETYAPNGWSLSPEQRRSVTIELYNPVTALEADPHDGALDAWRILERIGQIYVVTARADRYRAATYQWLNKHGLEPQGVIFDQDKGRVAANLGASLALEDAPKHLGQYAIEDIEAFKPDYPYNRRAPGTPYTSWKHLFTLSPLAELLERAIQAEADQGVAA